MRFCAKCGYNVNDDDNYCPACGIRLSRAEKNSGTTTDGSDLFDDEPVETTRVYNTDSGVYYTKEREKNTRHYHDETDATSNAKEHASFGLKLLSFFFPIVGAILYFLWRHDHRNKALEVGKSAIIGFVVGIGISIISNILIALL